MLPDRVFDVDKMFDLYLYTKEGIRNDYQAHEVSKGVGVIIHFFKVFEELYFKTLGYLIPYTIEVFILDTDFNETSYPKEFGFDPDNNSIFLRVYSNDDNNFKCQIYVDIKFANFSLLDKCRIIVSYIANVIMISDYQIQSVLNILSFYNQDRKPPQSFSDLVALSLNKKSQKGLFARQVLLSLYSLSRAYN